MKKRRKDWQEILLQRKLRREYRIVENIRLHRQKKLMQRFFYQTSSQQIGGNKCSSDSYTVRLHVHQKNPWPLRLPAFPCWPQKPFTLETEEDTFLDWMSWKQTREQRIFCLLLLVFTDVSRENTFAHLCTKDKTGNKSGRHVFACSAYQSGCLLFRVLISLPVTFSWNNCHISLMLVDHIEIYVHTCIQICHICKDHKDISTKKKCLKLSRK